MPLFGAAREVAARLKAAGHRVLFAGGCVRDAVLGRRLKDVDIATSASPDAIEALFRGATVAVGKSFGVIKVRCRGFDFDVATFRTDGDYRDGRHPEAFAPATPEGDAVRRDFTVNGLFADPETGEVIDYVGGLADLGARVIRAIGEPEARFREDHLRMFRAIRFASVLGFAIDPAVREAITRHADWLRTVSAERISSELIRLLTESPKPSVGLNLLLETGLLAQFLPEVVAFKGCAQPPKFHPEGDVWTHTCLMLDELARAPAKDWAGEERVILFLAVLLHDIGKPPTACVMPCRKTGEPCIRFPNHAAVGAPMAEEVLRRLKQPADRIAAVTLLVAEHMHFVDVEKMRTARLRRFLGLPHFDLLTELLRLDTLYSNGDLSTYHYIKEKREAFLSEPVLPEPVIHGRDLLARGYPAGPALGKMLEALYDAQLEGRLDEALAALPPPAR